MTSELITFNHLRCHSSSTALGTRTGYRKPTQRGTNETPLWYFARVESPLCYLLSFVHTYHDLNKISKTTSERIRVKFSQSGAPALCDNHFVIASVMLWIIFKLWKQLISLLEYSLQLCSANSCPYSPGCMATIMMMHYLLPTSTLLIYLS